MVAAYVAFVLVCSLLWLAWQRATKGRLSERLSQVGPVRELFSDLDRSVARLLVTSEGTRKGWFLAAGSLGSSRLGPVAREAQILEEALRQAQAVERRVLVTPTDIGQLSVPDLGSVSASLRLMIEIVRGQQLCVDASRRRLEAFKIGAEVSNSMDTYTTTVTL